MLPSTDALRGVPADVWPALKRRLAELGVCAESVLEAQARGAGVHSLLRAPIVKWHARRSEGTLALALRCLFLADGISRAEASEVFGPLFEPLQRACVLEERASGWSSPYQWGFMGPLLVLADPLSSEPQTVMGHSQTTVRLCRAVTSGAKVQRALDLGCGAGAIAMVLAAQAEHVIATDINERAVTIARINLTLNDVSNVEVRRGDLFEPVRSERFDLIVSQPPFIAKPQTADSVAFLYGGERGDELAQRILAGLPSRLSAGGRAVLLVEWPEVPGDPLDSRIRNALGDASKNLLVIQSPPINVDEHCAMMATTVSKDPTSPEFETDVLARRDHFERMGVGFLRSTFVIVSPAEAATGWTKVCEARMSRDVVVDAAAIRRVEVAQALLARGAEALGSAKLRLPEGTELREVMRDDTRAVEVLPPSDRWLSAMRVNVPTASLLEWVNASEDVREAIEKVLQHTQAPSDELRLEITTTLARMLDVGLLEVA